MAFTATEYLQFRTSFVMAEIKLIGVTKTYQPAKAFPKANSTRNERQGAASGKRSTQKANCQKDPAFYKGKRDKPAEREKNPTGSSTFSVGLAADRQNAVDNLDLFVEDGEFLVLVGPSGCGKTTTLRLIAGLEQCDDGQISIGGRDVTNISPSKRDVAMVFQNYALYPHMTVYKNMAFGLEVKYGRGVFDVLRRFFRPAIVTKRDELRRGIESRVRQAAELLGIESLLSRRPHQLSGGERQRVALGRAIVRDPAAFLFDEPLSNLDAKLRSRMRLELGQLHHKLGATSVYVTHDQTEAMSLGNRIAVMNHGRIQQLGTPKEVYDRPSNTFVASFIGTQPMNLFPTSWEVNEQGLFLLANGPGSRQTDGSQAEKNQSKDRLEIPLDPNLVHPKGNDSKKRTGSLTLGVRPEHFQVCSASDGFWNAEIKAIDRLGDHCILHLLPNLGPSQSNVTSPTNIDTAKYESNKQNKETPTTLTETHKSQFDGRMPETSIRDIDSPLSNQSPWWTVRVSESEFQSNHYRTGASIGLRTECDKLHYFDAQMGQNLRDG